MYSIEWKTRYLLILAFSMTAVCCGTTYYLDTSSQGQGDGTSQDIQGTHAAWKYIYDITGLVPGDTVLFRRGQQWNQTLSISVSGEPGNNITFGAYGAGSRPLIDVTFGYGIVLYGVDYIEISDFDIIGSGAGAALSLRQGNGKSGSGADGQGFTIVIRNVSVLSNMSSGEGNKDGFSLHAVYPDGSSQALFYNISATKCRYESIFGGSHQAFTAHERCKAKVYTANFSDSVNWYGGAQNAQVEFYDLTAESSHSYGIVAGGGAGAGPDALCVISDSNLTINGSGKFVAIDGDVSRQGDKIVIADSIITSTTSVRSLTYGNLALLRNVINIDDPGWRIEHNAGLLTLEDNIVNCTGEANPEGVFDIGGTGQANITGNLFKFDVIGNYAINFHLTDSNSVGSVIENNIFKNFNNLNSAIYIANDSFAPVVSHNVFYNDVFGAKAIDLDHDGDETDVMKLELNHNIFYNTEDVVDDTAGGGHFSSYNCYYMSEDMGGIGSIVADPLFVNPDEDDFHLKSEGWRLDDSGRWTWDDVTSRCIDAGNPGLPLEDEMLAVPYDPDNDWSINIRTNIGAYGGTSQASMAPYRWSLLGDINNDGIIESKDISIMATLWLSETSSNSGDLNRDEVVNLGDFQLMADHWGKETIWTYKPGMIDDDYDVDIDDLAIIASYWFQSDCGSCSGADLTGDEKVNLADFALLASNWLHGVN